MPRERGGIGFSQACIGKSENRTHPKAIRPIGNRDVLVNDEGMDLEMEVRSNQKTNGEKSNVRKLSPDRSSLSQEDEEGNEGKAIKGQKRINLPSKEEWDNHMRCHIPFRRWCMFCVKGRCKSGGANQECT